MASCLSKDYTYLVFGLARIGIATSKFFEKYGYNFYATDDNEETIKHRLVEYENKTLPVAAYYNKQGKELKINGLGDIKRISEDIAHAIDSI